MGNANKLAAGVLGVCLLSVLTGGQPMAAQQPASPSQPADQSTSTPATQQPAATPAQAPAATPPPAIVTRGDFYAGQGLSITAFYWYGTGHPVMGTGHLDTAATPSSLDYAGKPRPAPGAIVSIPIGKYHSIHVSYFRVQGVGNPTAPEALIIYGTGFLQGDYLATHYTLQNAKVSLDYLSWPFPVKDSKFHIKTLWEFQFTTIASSIDAPLRHGETDASGNLIQTYGYGSNWFIYPSFGLGADYLFSHRFRFEARASGFAFPHHATVYDAEASLNYRFGKMELQGGVKTFHFKTSPGQNEFLQATYPGAYVGLRWYPEYSSH